MSQWVKPRHKVRDSGVINPEDFNEAIRPFDEQAKSAIGSSNVSSEALSTLDRSTNYEEGIALRVAIVQRESELAEDEDPGTEVSVTESMGWVVVHKKEFSTLGGSLYMLWSFQMGCGSDQNEIVSVQYGLRVNGGVINELVVGDQDYFDSAPSMELGVGGFHQGVEVDGAVQLPPGRHLVECVAKTIPLPGLTTQVGAKSYVYRSQFSLELAEA
jgi:hypothetical protein